MSLQDLSKNGRLEPLAVDDDCVITAFICPLGNYKYTDVHVVSNVSPDTVQHESFAGV